MELFLTKKGNKKLDITAMCGLINVPNGKWEYKSVRNGDVWPGFSAKVIPIVLSSYGSNASYQQAPANTQTTHTARLNNTIIIQGYVTPGSKVDLWALGATGYNLFLPIFYNHDYNKLITHTSGTILVWLQNMSIVGGGLVRLLNRIRSYFSLGGDF